MINVYGGLREAFGIITGIVSASSQTRLIDDISEMGNRISDLIEYIEREGLLDSKPKDITDALEYLRTEVDSIIRNLEGMVHDISSIRRELEVPPEPTIEALRGCIEVLDEVIRDIDRMMGE